jgi:hypothetical protein
MTTLLAIIKALLSFADGLTAYLHEQHLMDVGKQLQSSTNLQSALDAVQKANAIRDDVKSGKLSDPFIRD